MLRSITSAISSGNQEEVIHLITTNSSEPLFTGEERINSIKEIIRAAIAASFRLTALSEQQYFVKFDCLDTILFTFEADIKQHPAILSDVLNGIAGDRSLFLRERVLRSLPQETDQAVRTLLIGVSQTAVPLPLTMFNKFIGALANREVLTSHRAEALRKAVAQLAKLEFDQQATNDFFFMHDLWKMTFVAASIDLHSSTTKTLYPLLSETIFNNPQQSKPIKIMHHIYACELGVRIAEYRVALKHLDHIAKLNSELSDDERIVRAHLPQVMMARLSLLFCLAANVEQPVDEKKQHSGDHSAPKGDLRLATTSLKSLRPGALTDVCLDYVAGALYKVDSDVEQFKQKFIKITEENSEQCSLEIYQARMTIDCFYEWLEQIEKQLWPAENAVEELVTEDEMCELVKFLEIKRTLLQCVGKAADELDRAVQAKIPARIIGESGARHQQVVAKLERAKELLTLRTARIGLINKAVDRESCVNPGIHPTLIWAIKNREYAVIAQFFSIMDKRHWLQKKDTTTVANYLVYMFVLYCRPEELLNLFALLPPKEKQEAIYHALSTAVPENRRDIIDLLVPMGIGDLATDFHLAAYRGAWPANATAKDALALDAGGRLPLEWAVSGGSKETVAHLLACTPRFLFRFYYLFERITLAQQLELLPLIFPHFGKDDLENSVKYIFSYLRRRYAQPMMAIKTMLAHLETPHERSVFLNALTLSAMREGHVDIMLELISLHESDATRIDTVAYLLRNINNENANHVEWLQVLQQNKATAPRVLNVATVTERMLASQQAAYDESHRVTSNMSLHRVVERLAAYIAPDLEKHPGKILAIKLDFGKTNAFGAMRTFFRNTSPVIMQQADVTQDALTSSYKAMMSAFIEGRSVPPAAVAKFTHDLKSIKKDIEAQQAMLLNFWIDLMWGCEHHADKVDFASAVAIAKHLSGFTRFNMSTDLIKLICLAIAAGDYTEALAQTLKFEASINSRIEQGNAYLALPKLTVAKLSLTLLETLNLTMDPLVKKFQTEKWHELADRHLIADNMLPFMTVTDVNLKMLTRLNEQLDMLNRSSAGTMKSRTFKEPYKVNPVAVFELFASSTQVYSLLIRVEQFILSVDAANQEAAMAEKRTLLQLLYSAAQKIQPSFDFVCKELNRFAKEVQQTLEVPEDVDHFIKRMTEFHEQERKEVAERKRTADQKKHDKRKQAEERKAEERRLEEERKRAEEQRVAEERKQAEERRLLAQQKKEERRLEEERKRAEEQRAAEEQRQARARQQAEQRVFLAKMSYLKDIGKKQPQTSPAVVVKQIAETPDKTTKHPVADTQEIKSPDWFAGIPPEIINILRIFNHHNDDPNCPIALLTGGAVRDCLMGRAPGKDFDVAVYIDPVQLVDFLYRTFGPENITEDDDQGPRTWTVKFRGFTIDFTAIRPETTYMQDLKKDAQSRDFTCNAVYWNPSINKPEQPIKQILNPVNGYADIQARKLKYALVKPRIFLDYPTRLFRAIRFQGREFNFTFDQYITKDLEQCKGKIKGIPYTMHIDTLRKHYAKLSASLGDDTHAELEKFDLMDAMEAKGICKRTPPASKLTPS